MYNKTIWLPKQTIVSSRNLNNMENGIESAHVALESKVNKDEVYLKQEIDNKINACVVNVMDFGAKGDGTTNDTQAIQAAIDSAGNAKVLLFPTGTYLCSRLELGNGVNVTFRGTSDNRATFLNKVNGDTYTKIVATGLKEDEAMINQTNSMLIFENIGFYNSLDNTGDLYRKNVLVEPKISAEKGKFFLTNCQFYGWKTVFGCLEEVDYGGANDSKTDLLQSCVLATGCRFSHNRIALSQLVDSRVIDCSFNKNDYAIVMRKSAGITTISNCRIEWNAYNGIYVYQSHDLTINNNEFDRHGYAGLYIKKATNTKVTGNTFRRSGAYKDSLGVGLSETDFEKNVHIYANGCKESIFSHNATKYQKEFDGTISGRTVPYNCAAFIENTSTVISNNVLMGGYRKKTDPENMNSFIDNSSCVIENNVLKETRQTNQFNDIILSNESKVIKINNIPYLEDYDSTVVSVKIVEVSNDDSSQKTNFTPATLNLMLARANGTGMISKGKLINALDGSEVGTFKIVGIDYYPSSQVVSITLKNTDINNNRYIVSL